ncbi:hypothetical protein PIB19_06015 [Sphingomonas sp. 7/4-4]|uniref:hypothetical protein n=1 Tax=Sphingomonas sp. 7/4-4 TaxID=3018446 RepID=UPI0022F3A739|nr:hypothetical protein [Sphingomonas sp. 7/4-4]WBY08951.1 hypothetical protein PIB19_06015 [Sphingomonas sp. 7/4-4]
MGSFHSRRVALLLSTILAAGIGFPAFAQTGSPHPNLDANGVDLTTGQHQLELKVASLGSGSTELPLIIYTGESDNWSNITLYKELNSGGTRYSVVLGPSYDNFILGNPQSIRGTGATLTDNWESATYKTLDGTVIEFSNPLGFGGGTSNLCDSNNTNYCHLLPISITRKNGMAVNLQWEIESQCADVPLGEPGRDCTHTWRLSSVSNASGEIIWTYVGVPWAPRVGSVVPAQC